MKSVYLLATLDTKGPEAAFVRDQLKALKVPVLLVDTGCMAPPAVPADIPREKVFDAAGMKAAGDRGKAVTAAAEGAAKLVREAYARGEVLGVLGIGGSAGSNIG